MRVQKTRKRQRQREHVKQHLREDRHKNIEYYRENEEVKEVKEIKEVKEVKEVKENMDKPLRQRNDSITHVKPTPKRTIVTPPSNEIVDLFNDPKKLDEFKKFQEYLKMKEENTSRLVETKQEIKKIKSDTIYEKDDYEGDEVEDEEIVCYR